MLTSFSCLLLTAKLPTSYFTGSTPAPLSLLPSCSPYPTRSPIFLCSTSPPFSLSAHASSLPEPRACIKATITYSSHYSLPTT